MTFKLLGGYMQPIVAERDESSLQLTAAQAKDITLEAYCGQGSGPAVVIPYSW